MNNEAIHLPESGEVLFEGETVTLDVTVEDDAGDPFDLTNAEMDFTVTNYHGSEPHLEKTTNDIDISGNNNEVATITLTSDDTYSLPIYDEGRRFSFRFKVTDIMGRESVVAYGTMNFKGDYDQ